MIIQLHISEYQMLTNRVTYWISFQTSIWPLLFIFGGVVVGSWNSLPHGLLLWSSVLVFEGSIFLWCYLLGEIYTAIFYIERNLRKFIQSSVRGVSFWRYEEYLAKRRGKTPIWWEYTFTFSALIAAGIVSIARRPVWSRADSLALGLTLIFWVALAFANYNVVKIRLVYTRKLADSTKQIDLP